MRRFRTRSTHRSRGLALPSFAGRAITLAATALLAACGGKSGPPVPGPSGLAYIIPDPNPVSYVFGDTARFTIETGPMGSMRVVGAQEGEAELAFREDGGGFRVEVGFPRLDASFATAAQGTERADQSDLGGPLLVRLTHAGRIAVVDTPAMSPALAGMVGPETLVRPFFVHLPARPVDAGASWVDTVRTREETGGTLSSGRSVITTTLVGDTLVAGRRLLLLRTRSVNEIEVTGVSGGMEIEQKLTGTTRGHVLWDPLRALVVERREEGELSGTLALPGAGLGGLPVTGAVRRTVRLSGPAGP